MLQKNSYAIQTHYRNVKLYWKSMHEEINKHITQLRSSWRAKAKNKELK